MGIGGPFLWRCHQGHTYHHSSVSQPCHTVCHTMCHTICHTIKSGWCEAGDLYHGVKLHRLQVSSKCPSQVSEAVFGVLTLPQKVYVQTALLRCGLSSGQGSIRVISDRSDRPCRMCGLEGQSLQRIGDSARSGGGTPAHPRALQTFLRAWHQLGLDRCSQDVPRQSRNRGHNHLPRRRGFPDISSIWGIRRAQSL